MLNELRMAIKNGEREGTVCERALGTNTKVHEFAQFWDEHGTDLMVLSAKFLNDTYSDTEDLTSSEARMYKKGLAEIGTFFFDCWMERENKKQTPDET